MCCPPKPEAQSGAMPAKLVRGKACANDENGVSGESGRRQGGRQASPQARPR